MLLWGAFCGLPWALVGPLCALVGSLWALVGPPWALVGAPWALGGPWFGLVVALRWLSLHVFEGGRGPCVFPLTQVFGCGATVLVCGQARTQFGSQWCHACGWGTIVTVWADLFLYFNIIRCFLCRRPLVGFRCFLPPDLPQGAR